MPHAWLTNQAKLPPSTSRDGEAKPSLVKMGFKWVKKAVIRISDLSIQR